MIDPMTHNYMKKLVELYKQGKLPTRGVSDIYFFHDDWCGIYRGRRCNCEPNIEIRPRRMLDVRRN
jgi:hypothetical protein